MQHTGQREVSDKKPRREPVMGAYFVSSLLLKIDGIPVVASG
jgi:hypothetical protein